MDERIVCSTTDSIELLGLSVRVFNALKRSKIWDIGEVYELSDDQLFAVRNLGEKGVAEIRERLAEVTLIDAPPPTHENNSTRVWSEEPQILIDLGPPTIPRHEIVKWQQTMLSRQIEAGTLHPQLEIDGYTLAELLEVHSHTAGLYEILLRLLEAPISVAQELERLLANVPHRELDILIRRFGFARHTLNEVASVHGITRERVRQIQIQAVSRIVKSGSALQVIRIRSAILFSGSMALSFNDWSSNLVNSGLMGDWKNAKLAGTERLELMLMVIKLLGVSNSRFETPNGFKNIIQLHNDGMPDAPARLQELLNSYYGEVERLVRRHLRYSGAVSLDWLANHDSVDLTRCDLCLILESKGYFALDENWYMSREYVPECLEKDSVLHRSLFKMFQFCGALDIRNVYAGTEHTLAKTDFPIPPIETLEKALVEYGYAKDEGGWNWHGKKSEELNTGEAAIWNVIENGKGVAHHSELMLGILDSGLSGASLGATLARSPLFEKFESALYRLRGTRPSYLAIDRARSAAAKVPMRLSVVRDTFGNISIGANLGILAVANGTLVSDNLPNLSGNWHCRWSEEDTSEIRVTRNEIRGLVKAFRHLECQVGDRIELIFNVFDRSVFVQMEGANT